METFLKITSMLLLLFIISRRIEEFKSKENKKLNPIVDIVICLFVLTINIGLGNKFEVVLSSLCIALIGICEIIKGEIKNENNKN